MPIGNQDDRILSMKTARFGGPSSGEYGPMQGHALPHRSAGPPAPGPNGLPPPSFSHAFSQGNHNPFAVTGNVNGLAAGFGMNTIGSGGTGLGSKEAQEGFAYGAQLQAREQSQGAKTHLRMKQAGRAATDARIRDVWASNMREEMDLLEQLVEHFPFISMVSLSGLGRCSSARQNAAARSWKPAQDRPAYGAALDNDSGVCTWGQQVKDDKYDVWVHY